MRPTNIVTQATHTPRKPLAHLRAPLACRVGCPAQAYVPELRRTCGGHVHSGWFCFYVRGARAYPVEAVRDVVYHEGCGGCCGDHGRGREGTRPLDEDLDIVLDTEGGPVV